MKSWFHPEARVELLESVAYYELLLNIYEAVEGRLSVEVQEITVTGTDKIMEIAV